jgi:tripartite-type tricarboxylate transporter receptor subunit TctC
MLARSTTTAFLIASTLASGFALAQSYPERPLRAVLPYPPGGGTDSMARIILPKLGEALGQPIVIDNRPGAGGALAAEIVVKAAPDGYTLLMASATGVTAAPHLYKLTYDPIRDLAPITQTGTAAFTLSVNPKVPAKSVAELVALAKAKPGGLNYASGGIGSPLNLAGELFKSRASVNIVHVAYKGGVPAVTAVLSGEAQVIFGSFASSLPHVKAGRLRALAVTGSKRSPLLPNLPTMVESGFPGFLVLTWNALDAPTGTPASIVNRLQVETTKVLRRPEVIALMAKIGYEATGTSAAEYDRIRREESAMWAKVIKDAGIRAR